MVSAAGMIVMFTLQTVCSALYAEHGTKSAGDAVVAFIFLYYGFYDIAFTPLIVSYTVEILPYNIRAKGFNVFNFTISLSLIFNQYVNPIALSHIGWKYYIVYVVWITFELVFCYLFVIETKNVSISGFAFFVFDADDLLLSALSKKPPSCSMVRMLSRRSLTRPLSTLTSRREMDLRPARRLVTSPPLSSTKHSSPYFTSLW